MRLWGRGMLSTKSMLRLRTLGEDAERASWQFSMDGEGL
jgi:hypothetical protein